MKDSNEGLQNHAKLGIGCIDRPRTRSLTTFRRVVCGGSWF